MNTSKDTAVSAWLRLLRTPGVGPVRFAKILEVHGSPEIFLQAKRAAWRAAGLKDVACDYLAQDEDAGVTADLEWAQGAERHILLQTDPRYPQSLRELHDAPPLLFVQGDLDLLSTPQLAIVGSRNPTAGGRDNAREFAASFARAGITVTSGLAIGIDGAAHEGALNAGGFSIAVCATGLEQVYPARHRDLAHRLAKQGALVSEFATGTEPRAEYFPRRNRIISALSQGVLVVEAAERSGSLITARLAVEQGHEVFAIPGSIHNPLSKGCHRLIRQGAKLVESAADVLEEIGPRFANVAADWRAQQMADKPPAVAEDDDTDTQSLLKALGQDPVSMQTLIERSGLTADRLSAMLTVLEIDGRITTLPGGRYQQIQPSKS